MSEFEPKQTASIDPDAILAARFDSLKPYVRRYAEHLRDQIMQVFERYDVRDYQAFKRRALDDPGSIGKDAVDHLHGFLQELKKTIENNSAMFDSSIHEGELNLLIVHWAEFLARNNYSEQTYQLATGVERESEFLEAEIAQSFPPLSCEQLRNDPNLLQTIAERIATHPVIADPLRFYHVGVVLSALYRHALKNLSQAEMQSITITQRINLERFPQLGKDFIGYRWPGGELSVSIAGKFFGQGMIDGVLRAERVGDYAAYMMEGGKMKLGQAGKYLGCYADGGSIWAHEADENAGDTMRGGHLYVDIAGDNFAYRAENGYLFCKNAARWAAMELKGGHVMIEKADQNACHGMNGGKVEVAECAGFGFVEGGEVYHGGRKIHP